jgi:hypothetical protein
MCNHQLTMLEPVSIEQVKDGVIKTGQQHPAVAQHAESLAPHRQHIGDKDIRNRMENKVEAFIGESR